MQAQLGRSNLMTGGNPYPGMGRHGWMDGADGRKESREGGYQRDRCTTTPFVNRRPRGEG